MTVTHADIEESPNAIVSLCGLRGGDYVWQGMFNIEYDGKVFAEVTCERCRTTAQFYHEGYSLTEARAIARKQEATK